MHTAWRPVVSFFLIPFLFLFGITAIRSADAADEDMITVRGTGYPPIRAESAAQAHLMAKRAAVVDAYRNALSGKAASRAGHDVTYRELSGFVSGMKVVNEEYLSDGGIRITAVVPKNKVKVATKAYKQANETGDVTGPAPVTRDEWYRVIDNLVRMDK